MSAATLPLFPLPLVLFPGTPQLLHIFEPRYRQMLRDCLAGDGRFGLSVVRTNAGDQAPEPGDVGCRALIRSHRGLPDGRANILATGEERFVLRELIDHDRLYHKGVVEFFDDEPDADPAVPGLAQAVRASFSTLVEHLGTLIETTGPSIEIPTDPLRLSFHVAAAVDIEVPIKEELLRLTSTRLRLERLRGLLEPLVRQVSRRTAVYRRAKRNGSGGHAPVGTAP